MFDSIVNHSPQNFHEYCKLFRRIVSILELGQDNPGLPVVAAEFKRLAKSENLPYPLPEQWPPQNWALWWAFEPDKESLLERLNKCLVEVEGQAEAITANSEKKRRHPTQIEMDNRNRKVTKFAEKHQAEHECAPRVETEQIPAGFRKKRRRPTAREMANRNRTVTKFVVKFQTEHDRAPSVGEVQNATRLEPKRVYATTAYKERKISRPGIVTPAQISGRSVVSTEQFKENSEQASRTRKRTKFEQEALDGAIDEQARDDNSDHMS